MSLDYQLLIGDCHEAMRSLPDQSVHCCVTSPPYFGLRDYGTANWKGGDPDCNHRPSRLKVGRSEQRQSLGNSYATHPSQLLAFGSRMVCDKCSATKTDQQIGLEPSPDDFVEALVGVFREVRRVLCDDGTLWLNLGDSYASGGGTGKQGGRGQRFDRRHTQETLGEVRKWPESGIKPKDLIGIPWRVALALQADGWYLRQDIIWHKPNPMPESVRDRCTKAHEYVFLLSKGPRYYYDHEAVKEIAASPRGPGNLQQNPIPPGQRQGVNANIRGSLHMIGPRETRNRRSVWTVSTRPYKGAHFATFPPDLIEPCILAGCPEGGTVLDPFGGSGTTAGVALAYGRNAILCELNPEYAELVPDRVQSIFDYYGFDPHAEEQLTLWEYA